jgi:MFS transporter, Spinster family, sphingosine-1-phosphate transporter
MTRPPSARAALALLTGVNLLNYVDRYVPAGALPMIIAAYGLSDTQGGSLQLLFMIGYSAMSPVVGWMGDRGRRFVLAGAGVLIWTAATFGSGLATSFGLFLASRALIGVGEASYAAVTPSLLGDYFPPARRGRALAIFSAAMPVGIALGYTVGGQIGARLGWQWAFYVAGIPGALLGIMLILLRDPVRGALDAPPVSAAAPSQARPPAAPSRWRDLLEYPSYRINVAAQTIFTFAMGGLGIWMPTFFSRERGLSQATASTMFGGVLCLAGFVGTLVGGQLGDRLAARHRAAHFSVSGIALLSSIPFSVLAIQAPWPAIFWPALFVTLTLLFLNTAPLNAAMTNVLPPELRARGFGAYILTIHVFGDAFSPMVIGFASDRIGLRLPVLFTALMLGAAGVVLLAGRRALERDLAGKVMAPS